MSEDRGDYRNKEFKEVNHQNIVTIAPALHDRKWGFINSKGEWVIPATYAYKYSDREYTPFFSNGVTVVVAIDNGLLGLMKWNGKMVTDFIYTEIYISNDSIFQVNTKNNQDALTFVDTEGNEYLFYNFELVGQFSSGIAPAMQNGKFGFIDKSGKAIIPFKYRDANPFLEDIAWVDIGHQLDPQGDRIPKWSAVDRKGKMLFKTPHASVIDFVNGFSLVGKDYFQVIDKQGNIFDPKDCILPSSSWNYFKHSLIFGTPAKLYEKGETLIALGKVGKGWLTAPKFEETRDFGEVSAPVKAKGKWGIIDTSGAWLKAPLYDSVGWYSEGLIPVKFNKLWGYADERGKIVIEPQFENAHAFSSGLAAVQKNKLWGFINHSGKLIIDFLFEKTGNFQRIDAK